MSLSLKLVHDLSLQVHGSCESVANIDLEGMSTSVGLSEHMPDGSPRTVTVLYAPPDLELHDTPTHVAMAVGSVQILSDGQPLEPPASPPDRPRDRQTADIASIHSISSDDLAERQALMSCEEDTSIAPVNT